MTYRYGPPLPLGQRPLKAKMVGGKGPLRFSLRIGELTRVDYENMVCDISWLQGKYPPSLDVPLTSAYWSPRSFLGAMPEEGAVAVCGFSAIHHDQGVRPYILSYISSGYRTALGFQPFGLAERNASELNAPLGEVQKELENQFGATRYKFRKIYPGDVYGASSQGSELLLDRNAKLWDAQGNSFELRAEDSRAILQSLDVAQVSAAGRSHTGRVIRSALHIPSGVTFGDDGRISASNPLFQILQDAGIIYPSGELTPDINALPYLLLESGERLGVITENSTDPALASSRTYTESRTELYEWSDQQLPVTDLLDIEGLKGQRPFIERVVGTLVGNDPYTLKGRSQYGQTLRPALFDSPSATTGVPRLETVDNRTDSTEKSLVGAGLYRMQRPDGDGELFMAHDKEGHVYLSIPASSSKPSNLGGGRSVEADLKGSTKLVMGANTSERESLNLFAKGGFDLTLGTLSRSERSLDLTTRGGVALRVQAPDLNGYAFQGSFQGDYGVSVTGSEGLAVSGDSLLQVQGTRDLNAEGVIETVGLGGKSSTILGDEVTQITGTQQVKINGGRDVSITAPSPTSPYADKLEILAGSRLHTFTAPTTDTIRYNAAATRNIQAAGALNASWVAGGVGTYQFSAASGSFAVNVGTGAISMNAGGAISMTSGASIALTAASISLKGSVGLGAGASAPNAVVGGIPGPSPYVDPITGLPATGNPLVRTV